MTDRTGDDVDHAIRLREEVRDRYGRAATAVAEGARNTDLLADVPDDVEPDPTSGSAAASCCGSGPVPVRFGAGLYGTDETDGLPADGLEAAGFTHARATFTHEVADAMHAAIIHATRPVA